MTAGGEPRLDRDALRALAHEVAGVLAGAGTEEPLLTARQIAARFNVDRSWVYAHAHELGVVRIGAGPRPRLRFDPAVIERLLLPPRGRTAATPASQPTGAEVPLLPIGSARRRTLSAQR